MNLVILIPTVIVLGVIYLVWVSRRTKGRGGPGTGVAGRPDALEPHELTGTEEHKHRP